MKAKKWSLIEFVQSLGINYGSYKSGIRYGNLPRVDEALKITCALGVSVEYFIDGADADSALSSEDHHLLDVFHNASPDTQQGALVMLER